MNFYRSYKPPFLTHPDDSNSQDFRFACLAWYLITSKTRDELDTYLATQPEKTRETIRSWLIKCKAWIWLTSLNRQEIVAALNLEEDEREPLRSALNELRTKLEKSHDA